MVVSEKKIAEEGGLVTLMSLKQFDMQRDRYNTSILIEGGQRLEYFPIQLLALGALQQYYK